MRPEESQKPLHRVSGYLRQLVSLGAAETVGDLPPDPAPLLKLLPAEEPLGGIEVEHVSLEVASNAEKRLHLLQLADRIPYQSVPIQNQNLVQGKVPQPALKVYVVHASQHGVQVGVDLARGRTEDYNVVLSKIKYHVVQLGH